MRLGATLGSFGLAGALLLGQCQPQCGPPPAQVPAPAPPPPASTAAAVQQVVDLTNARRAEAGLAPLVVHGALTLAAQVHSDDQAARSQMSHIGSDGSDPGQRIAATGYVAGAWSENVAYGYPDAASVMDGWMGSDGHRANILDATFTQIGVAVATSARGTPYWTMVLARPG